MAKGCGGESISKAGSTGRNTKRKAANVFSPKKKKKAGHLSDSNDNSTGIPSKPTLWASSPQCSPSIVEVDDEDGKTGPENSDDEHEWLSKDWKSTVYTFYDPIPDILYVGG
ncbi:hypothetical protein BJV78DRAFT_1158920 [Lactifluus subvellereus]|nr:hypothetical protein BJV78DRAFT_1158920 [Lactifluus subvellereus]